MSAPKKEIKDLQDRSNPFGILYFFDHPSGPDSGVSQKVMNQITTWRDRGVKAKLFLITPKRYQEAWTKVLANVDTTIYGYESLLQRLLLRVMALIPARRPSKEFRSLTYLRLGVYTPLEIILLRSIPYVIEVNTNASREYEIRFPRLSSYFKAMEKVLFKQSSGSIYVTRELEKIYRKRYSLERTSFITNGIRLNDSNHLSRNLSREDFDFDAVFLATDIKKWHGVDQVLDWAELLPRLRFILVARNFYEEFSNAQIPKNVEVLTSITPDEEKDLLSKCIIGISALNVELVGLQEGSNLKTRTYLANGLPVIIGHDDYAFDLNSKIKLDVRCIPSRDLINQIEEFVDDWSHKRVEKKDVINISLESTESARLAFFKTCLESKAAFPK